MIRIKTIKIEEIRGIRELSLDLEGGNFGICGPYGTGKSGVVDAIEFCLTGNIARLAGQGAVELSVTGHAPHVDQRANPDKAKVTIRASIRTFGKGVTIKRSVKHREMSADLDLRRHLCPPGLKQVPEEPERKPPALRSGPPAALGPTWAAAFMTHEVVKEADAEGVETRPVERQPDRDVPGRTGQ